MDKIKMQKEITNYTAWLHGLYVYDAVGVALHNAFAEKGIEPQTYLKEPIDINMTKEEYERKKRLELENQIRKALGRKKEIIEGR